MNEQLNEGPVEEPIAENEAHEVKEVVLEPKKAGEPKLTTLERELQARDITPYKLILRKLGKPSSTYTRWLGKVRGKRDMSIEQLQEICAAVTEMTPENPLTLDVLDIDISWLRMN